MDNVLVLKDVTKKYATAYAVDHISLELQKGEFLTLLGPSGSGKTTTLKMIAGLEIPTAGEISINGKDITDLPPNKRGLGMVFQNYALFPHMTIGENIAFPLKMQKKYSKQEISQKIKETLDLIQLPGFEDRYPVQLSGGQQQRVALGRALVFQPSIILMDEPLGALDKKLRKDMQLEIKRIQQRLHITTVYVTHDQEEALTMSDRIAIYDQGRIEQIGTPREIYENPVNAFVADFIGESNFLPIDHIEKTGTEYTAELKSERHSKVHFAYAFELPDVEEKKIFVRPEKLQIGTDLPNKKLDGVITDVIYLGEMIRYIVKADDTFELLAKQQLVNTKSGYKRGDAVEIGWDDDNLLVL